MAINLEDFTSDKEKSATEKEPVVAKVKPQKLQRRTLIWKSLSVISATTQNLVTTACADETLF